MLSYFNWSQLMHLQIYNFKNTICSILCQEKVESEDLIIATFKMLTSAARYQVICHLLFSFWAHNLLHCCQTMGSPISERPIAQEHLKLLSSLKSLSPWASNLIQVDFFTKVMGKVENDEDGRRCVSSVPNFTLT